MKSHILPFVVLFVLCTLTPMIGASQKTKITSGIVAYNSAEYEDALSLLNEGLSNPTLLDTKTESKGLFYKGNSILALMQMASKNQDVQKLEQYKDGVIDAYYCYKKSYELDAENKHKNEITERVIIIYPAILQAGMAYLNEGNLKTALNYFDVSVSAVEHFKINDQYIAYDLRAQTHLNFSDTLKALSDFIKSSEYYSANLPSLPDFYIGYVYYRLAIIQRYHYKDDSKALASIESGIELIDKEYSRMQNLKNAMTTESLANNEALFSNVKNDLQLFELDIFLNNTNLYQKALSKFEKSLIEHPNNNSVRIAYASLLEKSDVESASQEYMKVIESDPTNFTALFNCGTIFINKAVEVNKKANESEDYDKASALQKEVLDLMGKALPYFEKAHKLNPSDLYTIGALIQITLSLNMTDEYTYYKKLQLELKGN